MRLMHPPKKIEVERVDTNGVPTQISYQGNFIAVRNAAGPERIDSGWWQGATQQRDYYRIALTSGSWLWIYRDRRDQNWYLHGEFD
jgi:protein ImuB